MDEFGPRRSWRKSVCHTPRLESWAKIWRLLSSNNLNQQKARRIEKILVYGAFPRIFWMNHCLAANSRTPAVSLARRVVDQRPIPEMQAVSLWRNTLGHSIIAAFPSFEVIADAKIIWASPISISRLSQNVIEERRKHYFHSVAPSEAIEVGAHVDRGEIFQKFGTWVTQGDPLVSNKNIVVYKD